MRSTGEALATGLERGIGIARTFQQDDERRQEKADAKARQQRLDAQADEDRTRRIARENREIELADDERAFKAVDDELKGLAAEIQGAAQQAGGFDKLPPEVLAGLNQRQIDAFRRRRDINEKRLRPVVERERKSAMDLVDRIKRGEVDVASVPDDELYRAMGIALRRDPRQLLRQGNTSPLGSAVQRLLEQIETPTSPEDLVAAANVILEPELRSGVGEPGRDGSVIVKKEIERFVPAPGGGGKILPVLRVHVRRADGATGSYLAPVTAGRSSDGDDDEVVQVDLGDAMNHIGRLSTAEELFNHPEIRAKLERGAAKGQPTLDQFLANYFAIGGKPFKRKTKVEERKLGDRNEYITRDAETNEQIGEVETRRVGIDPTRAAVAQEATRRAGIGASRPSELRRYLNDLEAEVEAGRLTREEADRLADEAIAARASGGGGRPGAGVKPMSEEERKKAADNAATEKASSLGLSWDPTRRTWLTAEGKQASAEQRAQITRAREDSLKSTQSQARGAAPRPAGAPKVDDATRARLNEMRQAAGLPLL